MKKVLAVGAGSYIAASFCAYAKNRLEIEAVGASNGQWRNKDLSGFDAVINFAGIAHRRETPQNESLYYEINRDLAAEIARKAKTQGVKQYILLSSMSVYGRTTGHITAQTQPMPNSCYGDSKLEGEKLVSKLSDGTFRTAIVRPPMVYGAGCKGNFPALCRLARKAPVFPDLFNERSMIYIDNLCELLCLIVLEKADGLFYPQDKEYGCTREIVCAAAHDRTIAYTKLLNPALWFLLKHNTLFSKVFGDLTYDKGMSDHFNGAYQVVDQKTALRRSVG